MDYRTLVNYCNSRRMRQALAEFREACGVGGDEPDDVDGDGVADFVDGDGKVEDGDSLTRRVAGLEKDNRGLRELVDGQGSQLEELARRVATLEGREPRTRETETVDTGDDQNHDQGQGQEQDWPPLRRRPGMPDAGVVTLEEQPDEEHAFGPAAALVPEWRELQVGGDQVVNRVDRDEATVHRWELESKMLGNFHLTLPLETHPLDDARRGDHIRWRPDALAEARRELGKAKRMRLLKRALTLGLWRR